MKHPADRPPTVRCPRCGRNVGVDVDHAGRRFARAHWTEAPAADALGCFRARGEPCLPASEAAPVRAAGGRPRRRR